MYVPMVLEIVLCTDGPGYICITCKTSMADGWDDSTPGAVKINWRLGRKDPSPWRFRVRIEHVPENSIMTSVSVRALRFIPSRRGLRKNRDSWSRQWFQFSTSAIVSVSGKFKVTGFESVRFQFFWQHYPTNQLPNASSELTKALPSNRCRYQAPRWNVVTRY